MNNKTTISITEARSRIFQIADEVQNPAVFYTLTERGKPRVIILSVNKFESWQETLEVNHLFPDLKKEIKKIKKNHIKYTTLDDLFMQDYIDNKEDIYLNILKKTKGSWGDDGSKLVKKKKQLELLASKRRKAKW